MNPEEMPFEEFFTERMKQKGFTPKKLVDATGISPRHLAEIVRGDFTALPSAPYIRGYLLRLGQALDFDGEAWWHRIKAEGRIKNSGPNDALPQNRYMKKSNSQLILWGGVAVIVILYFIFQFSKIFGRPTVALITPAENPATALINPYTLHGTAKNADSVTINGDGVPLSANGTWQKDVLLSNGPNTFDIVAKKFLGGTSEINEEVFYQAPVTAPAPTSTATSSKSQ